MYPRTDIILPAHGVEAMAFAVRAVFTMWPQALIEDAVSGETWGRYRDIAFAGRRELLCYRTDMDAMKATAPPGSTVRLTLGDAGLIVTVDATPSPELAAFVVELRAGLR